MPLYNGHILQRELAPKERALAEECAGLNGELGYLVLCRKREEGGFFVAVSNDDREDNLFDKMLDHLPADHNGNRQVIRKEIKNSNEDKIYLNHISLTPDDATRLLPLFARNDDDKHRVFQAEKHMELPQADRKAIEVDWRELRENDRSNYFQSAVRAEIERDKQRLTLLVRDADNGMWIVQYSDNPLITRAASKMFKSWVKGDDALESGVALPNLMQSIYINNQPMSVSVTRIHYASQQGEMLEIFESSPALKHRIISLPGAARELSSTQLENIYSAYQTQSRQRPGNSRSGF